MTTVRAQGRMKARMKQVRVVVRCWIRRPEEGGGVRDVICVSVESS
jgi:hypothetical protein